MKGKPCDVTAKLRFTIVDMDASLRDNLLACPCSMCLRLLIVTINLYRDIHIRHPRGYLKFLKIIKNSIHFQY